MLVQSEFLKQIGVSHSTLSKYQEEGLFLPQYTTPTGRRIYYTERQVDEFKRYKGLSARSFAKEIGVSVSTLYAWNESNRLKADHTDTGGHLRYSYEQIEKYFAGDYNGVYEEGFIDRETFANLIGVSESTIILWSKQGLLCPDHKTVTRKWQYRPEQVDEAKKLKR